MEMAFIEIELIVAHIGGQEDVGQSVVVDIADGYASAVVKIPVRKDVFLLVVHDRVGEVDAGVGLEGEEGRGRRLRLAGTGKHACQKKYEDGDSPEDIRHWHAMKKKKGH